MMKPYKSKKTVNAAPSTSTQWKEYRQKLKNYSNADIEDGIDGYIVVYNKCTEKEYWSWSPKEEFESGYDEIETKSQPTKNLAKYA